MADDRYNWLDNDAAERLLRGEPVGTTAHGAQELARLLDDAAAAGPGTAPLPGEEAAVAAFHRAHHAPARASRAGLARPLRRGFAVALAACALGGVAVAAGTGVLPSPFRPGPAPASSVSTDVSPGTLESPEPGTTAPGSPDATAGERPTDDASTSPTPDASHRTTAPPRPGTTREPGRGVPGLPGNGKNGSAQQRAMVLALCRDYEAGKRGDMDRETLQRLERAAGGPAKIHAFCRRYLQQQGSGGGSGSGNGNGNGGTEGNGDGGGDAGTGQGGGHGGDEDGDGQQSTEPDDPAPAPSSPGPSASATVTPTPSTSADGTAPASV